MNIHMFIVRCGLALSTFLIIYGVIAMLSNPVISAGPLWDMRDKSLIWLNSNELEQMLIDNRKFIDLKPHVAVVIGFVLLMTLKNLKLDEP